MSSKQLIDLATAGLAGTNRGRAMSLKRRLSGPAIRLPSAKQRAFVEGLLSQPREDAAGAYNHPANGVAHNIDRKKTQLLPSDIAWLDRLPKDPDQVSIDDARTLYGLLKSLPLGRASESDRRLVQSHWGPIKALHDKAQAEHNLRLASRPLPEITTAAVTAVAEAMRNEDPALDEEFSHIQAKRALDAAHGVKARDRDQQIRWAERHITDPNAFADAS